MTLWLWLKISHLPYKYVCKYKKRVGVRKSIRQLSVTSCLQPCGVGRAQLQSGICLIRLPDRTEQKGRAPDETGKERKQSQCIVGVFFSRVVGSLGHFIITQFLCPSTPLPFQIADPFLSISAFFLSLHLCLSLLSSSSLSFPFSLSDLRSGEVPVEPSLVVWSGSALPSELRGLVLPAQS